MILALALLAPAGAQEIVVDAQVPDLNAQLFRPAIASPHFLWTDETATGVDEGFTTRGVVNWVADPLVYTAQDGERIEVLSDIVQTNLIGAYRIDRFLIGADVPLVLRSMSDVGANETGLGDIALDGRAAVLDRNTEIVGLSVGGRLGLPTSTIEGPLGSPGLSAELQAIVDRRFGDLLVAANVGHRFLPGAALENVDWNDQVLMRLGAAYTVTDAIGASLDLSGQAVYQDVGNPYARPMELMGGGWYTIAESDLVLRAGIGTGVGPGIGAPRVRTTMAVDWQPSPASDTDLDGLVDKEDACPNAPEDADGWEDADGCPEPTQVVIRFEDPEGTALTGVDWSIPDVDAARSAEGLVELAMMPRETTVSAELEGYTPKTASLVVPPGAPAEVVVVLELIPPNPATLTVTVTDPDGGVIDATVQLIDAETSSSALGLAHEVPAGAYAVFVEAEGFSPYRKDLSLEEGEKRAVDVVLAPAMAELSKEKIELADTVRYQVGSAKLMPASEELLQSVVAILEAHPEIVLLRIEGHTDDQGDAGFNQTLSENRAASVRDYLIDQGVSPSRLSSQGYGESRPLDTRATPAAWEKNRRVDFFVEEWAE